MLAANPDARPCMNQPLRTPVVFGWKYEVGGASTLSAKGSHQNSARIMFATASAPTACIIAAVQHEPDGEPMPSCRTSTFHLQCLDQRCRCRHTRPLVLRCQLAADIVPTDALPSRHSIEEVSRFARCNLRSCN